MADGCTKAVKDDLDNKSHPCIYCGRIFPSGKALGGHVSSAHVQPGKDLKGQKPKCSECGKEFGSVKALHGHMIAHRKRPPGGRKVMNKQKTNSKWSRPMTSDQQETFDDVPFGSASCLLVDVSEPMVSEYVTGDQWRNQTHDPATQKLLQLEGSDDSAKDKNVVNSSQKPEPANQTNNPILELKQHNGGISSGGMIIPEQQGISSGGMYTNIGGGDVTKISTPKNLANYPCPLCNKNFDSPQALGGHIGGHTRNNKLHHVNSSDEHKDKQPTRQKQNAKSSNNSHSGSSGVTGEQGTSTHVCNTCNKNFETYRRLKTHERCHVNRPVQVPPSCVATSSYIVEISGPVPVSPSHVTTPNSILEINGAAAMSSGSEDDEQPPDQPLRRVLSFDLNKPLEMEDDDFHS